MNTEEILQGDELIADFMGLEPMEWDISNEGHIKIWIDKESRLTVFDEPDLQYHSSWDWFHPAWDKFRKMDDVWLFTGGGYANFVLIKLLVS